MRHGLAAAGSTVFLTGMAARPAPARVRWRVDDTLRLGAIGLGRRMTNLLSRLGVACKDLRSGKRQSADEPMAGIEFVALCDVFEWNLEEKAEAVRELGGEPALYRDYREMLEKEDLDAVIVATPDFTHAPIAQLAVENGCDVYVEKCAANTPQQLRDLEAAVAKHEAIVQVGYQLRQDEIHLRAKEVIERGWIGEVRLVTFEVHRSGATGLLRHPLLEYGEPPDPALVDWDLFLAGIAPERPYDPERFFEWRKFWDYCNGICGDNESHFVDEVELMTGIGLPATASTSGGVYGSTDQRETPNVITACLEYPDEGLSLRFTEIDCNSGGPKGTWVYGTDGSLSVSWELKVYPDRFSSRYADALEEEKLSPHKPMIHVKDPAAAAALEANPSQMWLAGRGATKTTRGNGVYDTTRLHIEDFLSCVRSREQPAASLEIARNSTIAAQMSAAALRQGRAITPADLGFGPDAGE